MNAHVKRLCSECGEPTSLREYRGTVLCMACCVDSIDVWDDEPACDECKAPTARECECESDGEGLELDSERPDYAPDGRGRRW